MKKTSHREIHASCFPLRPAPLGWGIEPAMHGENDFLVSTGHTRLFDKDYSNFRMTGATVARSGLRTRIVNPRPGVFDFAEVLEQALSAKKNGVFVFWDLAHYDIPRFIKDPWSDDLTEAFVALALAFADSMHKALCKEFGICVFNEILFWAWCVDNGVWNMKPDARAAGKIGQFRGQCARTMMAVMREVHKKYPDVPFLIAEPSDKDHFLTFLKELRDIDQVEADKIVIGFNVYTHTKLPDTFTDPLGYMATLVASVRSEFPCNRLIIAETSWFKEDKMKWFKTITTIAKKTGVELVIWYPALHHPGWDGLEYIEHGGWDQNAERTPDTTLLRAVRRFNRLDKIAFVGKPDLATPEVLTES